MALLSLIKEDVPFAGLDAHIDSDFREILLHCFRDCNMACAFICQISDIDRCFIREHSVFEDISRTLKKSDRFIHSVVLKFFREVSFLVCQRICIAVSVGFEDAAVSVRHTGRYEGVCTLLFCLADIFNDVVAVDEDCKCLSHVGSLFYGLTLEQIAVYIECDIVRSKVVHYMEVIIVLDGADFIGRNRISKIKIAGIISRIDRCVVCAQHHLDLLRSHGFSRIPVRVLRQSERLLMRPVINCVRAI